MERDDTEVTEKIEKQDNKGKKEKKKDKISKKDKKSKKEKKDKKERKERKRKNEEDTGVKKKKRSTYHNAENESNRSPRQTDSENEKKRAEEEEDLIYENNTPLYENPDEESGKGNGEDAAEESTDDTKEGYESHTEDDEPQKGKTAETESKKTKVSDEENKGEGISNEDNISDVELSEDEVIPDDEAAEETMPDADEAENDEDEFFEETGAPPIPEHQPQQRECSNEVVKYYSDRKSSFNKYVGNLKGPIRDVQDVIDKDPKELIETLKELEALWQLKEGYESDPYHMTVMSRINLGLGFIGPLDPQDIEAAIEKNVFFSITMLEAQMSWKSMLDEETSEGQRLVERLKRMYDIIYRLYLEARATFRQTYKDKSLNPGMCAFSWQPRVNMEKAKNHQKFLLHVMRKLELGSYRRSGEDVHRAVWTPEGYCTNSWEKYMTIQEFVDSCVDPNTEWEAFNDLTAGSLYTRQQVATFLKYFRWSGFPDLELCSYLVSFRNGIFYMYKDTFIPYEKKVQMENELSKSEDAKPIRPNVRNGKYSSKNIFGLDTRFVSSNYIDLKFEDVKEKYTQVLDIPTPAVDKITHKQFSHLSKEPKGENGDEFSDFEFVNITYNALLGRTFFWGGDRDDWQTALYTIGRGGTGKTSLYQSVRNVRRPDNTATMSSNVERQWSLSSVFGPDKFSVWAPEIGEHFGFEQTDLQTCIAMEYVSIAKKHMTAFMYQWNTHFTLAGNVFPLKWKDQGDNLKRRLAMASFETPIESDSVDGELSKQLYEQTPMMLQKLIRCYLLLAENFGTTSFWNWCPDYFHEQSSQHLKSSDPLRAFIDSDWINLKIPVVSPSRPILDDEDPKTVTTNSHRPFCKKTDFEAQFHRYCKENNLNRTRLTPAVYGPVFTDKKISILKTPKEWKGTDVPDHLIPKTNGESLFGVGLLRSMDNFPSKGQFNYSSSSRDGEKPRSKPIHNDGL